MKRQVIAFLSLFSLVLVLSVYYVMMPFDEDNKDTNVNTETATELYFSTLLVARQNFWDNQLTEQTAVVASAQATNEEKAAALVDMAQLEQLMQLEADAVSLIKEAGFAAAYVETDVNTVKVIVAKTNPTKADAVIVFRSVYETFGAGIQPELTFRS